MQQDEAYVALTGALEEGQEAEDVKRAMLQDVASVVPGDSEIDVQPISFDPATLTLHVRFVKYSTHQDGATVDDEDGEGGADGDAAADGDAQGCDEKEASEGGKTPRAALKDKKGSKKTLGKGKFKAKLSVVPGPGTQVSSARDAMGVRDFLVDCIRSGKQKKVGSGAIRELADGALCLKPARVFVGATGQDTMWERKALYMSVLPALKNQMRRHRISLSWLDWHHTASSSSPNVAMEWSQVGAGQCERTPFGPPSSQVQPSLWRCVEAIDECTLPVPNGTRRPLALILVGCGADKRIPAIDEYILKQRLPHVLPPPEEVRNTDGGQGGRGGKGGKAGMASEAGQPRTASEAERPLLLQVVLGRLGVGDKSGTRFASRQYVQPFPEPFPPHPPSPNTRLFVVHSYMTRMSVRACACACACACVFACACVHARGLDAG